MRLGEFAPRIVLAAACLPILCCVDFSLPSLPREPTLETFFREGCEQRSTPCADPRAAFAGERLLVYGANFDPQPEMNLVLFGGEAARGEEYTSSGALVVTVPDDALSGPLLVNTSQGPSAPSAEAFRYRGLGHPRSGTTATTVNALLDPVGAAVIDGQVFLASGWMRAVIDADGRRVRLGVEPKCMASLPDARTLVFGSAIDGRLVTVNLATWPQTAAEPLVDTGLKHVRALFPAGPSKVYALGPKNDETTLVVVDLAGRQITDEKPLGLVYFDGASIAGGRWLVLPAGTGDIDNTVHEVAVVDLQTAGMPVAHVPLPDGEPIHRGWVTTDGARAYLPMVNGRVYLLDLQATPTWARRGDGSYDVIESFFGQVVSGIQALTVGSSNLLLAHLPGEGRLVALDLTSRRRLWSAPTSEDALEDFALDPDPTQQRVYVVDLRANLVFGIDYTTGRVVDELSFALALGSTSDAPAQGAAYDAIGRRVLVPARRGRVLVSVDVDSLRIGQPIMLSDDLAVSAPRAVQVSPKGQIVVLHESHLGFVEAREEDEVEAPELVRLDGLVQRLSFLGDEADSALVGMNDRVLLLRDRALVEPETAKVDFPGGFLELLHVEGDQVLVVWSQLVGQYDRPQAGIYSSKDLSLVRRLTLDPPADYEFIGALVVAGAPWLYYADSRGEGVAQSLASWNLQNFKSGGAISSSVAFIGPVAATPDGRRLLWTDVLADDGRIRFARYRAAQGALPAAFLGVSAETLPSPLCGAAFSETGERAFIPTCGGDAIVVVE